MFSRTSFILLALSHSIKAFSTDPFDFSPSDDAEGSFCRDQRQQEIIKSERCNLYPNDADICKHISHQERVQEANAANVFFDGSVWAVILEAGGLDDPKLKTLATKLATKASIRCAQLTAACGDVAKTIAQNISMSYAGAKNQPPLILANYMANVGMDQILSGMDTLLEFFDKIKVVFTAPSYTDQRKQACEQTARAYFRAMYNGRYNEEDALTTEDCVTDSVRFAKGLLISSLSSLVTAEARKATLTDPSAATAVTSIAAPFTTFCESVASKCYNSTFIIGQYITRAILYEKQNPKDPEKSAVSLCAYVEKIYLLFAASLVNSVKELQKMTKQQERDLRDVIKETVKFLTSNLAALAGHIPPFIYPAL